MYRLACCTCTPGIPIATRPSSTVPRPAVRSAATASCSPLRASGSYSVAPGNCRARALGRVSANASNEWWRAEQGPAPPPPWPFAGGWFLYLGYELAGEVEPTLTLPLSALDVVACAWRMRAALVHDHRTGQTVVAAEPGAEAAAGVLATDFASARPEPERADAPAVGCVAEDDPATYVRACLRALAHIAAGDVYQANLARRWSARMPDGLTAAGLYGRLRAANPGAFAGIAALPGFTVLSSSPERLVRVQGRHVDTRPIAGTRPRLANGDAAAIAELTGSPKEQAEHVMLIDLERNDLGRLCEAGSVRVDEFMAVESYAHVHHIVSNVSGTLRADVEPGDVIRALFPGGTITGCPKVRCMAVDRGTRRCCTRRLYRCDGLPCGRWQSRPQYPHPDDDLARWRDRIACRRWNRRGFRSCARAGRDTREGPRALACPRQRRTDASPRQRAPCRSASTRRTAACNMAMGSSRRSP